MTAPELVGLCDIARGLAGRIAELGQARQAWEAYSAAVGADEQAVTAAKEELHRLEVGRHRPVPPPFRPVSPQDWVPPATTTSPPTPPPLPFGRVLAPDRELLRQLVNVHRVRWKLGGTLAQLNRIADNPAHPLGEAIVLLPAAAFDPTPDEEAPEHADRLNNWARAVAEYVEHLEDQLHEQQGQTRGLEGVLARWREREAGDPLGWDQFVAARRGQLRAELEELRRRVDARRLQPGGQA